MLKKIFFLTSFCFILFNGNGLATSFHLVNLDLQAFTRISVSGSASIILTATEFRNLAEKDFEGDVNIYLKSNCSCTVSAKAASLDNFPIPINYISAKIDAPGASYHPLNTTAVDLASFGSKQSGSTYSVLYKLTNIRNLANSDINVGNYSTTIEYTVITSS